MRLLLTIAALAFLVGLAHTFAPSRHPRSIRRHNTVRRFQ